jgi:hypothetical protein
MVRFYEYFRKHQIFMEEAAVGHFEKGFRFLQQVFGKKGECQLNPDDRIAVGMTVYADLIKVFPEMLNDLRMEVRRTVGIHEGIGRKRGVAP